MLVCGFPFTLAKPFCPEPQTVVSLSRIDVSGGEVIGPPADLSGLALLEQFAAVEQALDMIDQTRTITRGMAHVRVRQLPFEADSAPCSGAGC